MPLLEKLSCVTRKVTSYRIKTAARDSVALTYLRNPGERAATVLVMALRSLYGVGILAWEPESIWLSLERDYAIDLDVISRDKIQAAITLTVTPSFYWDNLVFQRTTQALNGELYDPEALQECHPAHMNWAVYEAQIIRGHDPSVEEVWDTTRLELDEDVQQYIAVCLYRAGYVYPPPMLLPIRDNLAKLASPDSESLRKNVKKKWEHLDKGALQDRVYPEDSLGVQLSKLASCEVYRAELAELLAVDVLALDRG